jgi:hypothetical protein
LLLIHQRKYLGNFFDGINDAVREGRTRTNQLQKKYSRKKNAISKTETTKWRKTFVLQVQGIRENFEKNKSSVEEKNQKIVA